MSDYISKSALIKAMEESKNQPTRDTKDFIEGYCEGWNDVADIIVNQSTLDEKEIIRKPFERVVERLEEASCYVEDGDGHAGHFVFTEDAIEIVKEECGINE